MKWNLLYPDCVQEADEYSIEYINRREKAEQQWATSNFTHIKPSEELLSTLAHASLQEHPTNMLKRAYQGNSGSNAKRR
jgi:acetylornithine/succinyldiaminopimelate/putrescine aminotransferase